ncbi:uncharacterized protein LOC117315433 [Pecten maximus]|uniref:uncharacterized protein LOC117315433 n=1 Tax=Pecten maximus TaxID=6579 RepID=UPI001458F16E|nr:uncharacterized protein LOC117315433 [Pecten maximus]
MSRFLSKDNMDQVYVYLAVFSFFSQAKGSGGSMFDMTGSGGSMSVRTTDCSLVYTCPTFCLKSKGKCFVCHCGEPFRSFLKSAPDRLKHDYQFIYQTGSQFTNGQMNDGKSAASGNQAGPFSMGGMMGGRNWMSTGSASVNRSQWIGGVNAMTGMSQQWNIGQGSIGTGNQGKLAPMMMSYLQPDFQGSVAAKD